METASAHQQANGATKMVTDTESTTDVFHKPSSSTSPASTRQKFVIFQAFMDREVPINTTRAKTIRFEGIDHVCYLWEKLRLG